MSRRRRPPVTVAAERQARCGQARGTGRRDARRRLLDGAHIDATAVGLATIAAGSAPPPFDVLATIVT